MLSTEFEKRFDAMYYAVIKGKPLHITAAQAGHIFGLCAKTINKKAKAGEIKGYKNSASKNATYLFTKEDLKRYFIQLNVNIANNINRKNQ